MMLYNTAIDTTNSHCEREEEIKEKIGQAVIRAMKNECQIYLFSPTPSLDGGGKAPLVFKEQFGERFRNVSLLMRNGY